MYVYVITAMSAVDAVARALEGRLFDGHNGPERGLLALLLLHDQCFSMISTAGLEALSATG